MLLSVKRERLQSRAHKKEKRKVFLITFFTKKVMPDRRGHHTKIPPLCTKQGGVFVFISGRRQGRIKLISTERGGGGVLSVIVSSLAAAPRQHKLRLSFSLRKSSPLRCASSSPKSHRTFRGPRIIASSATGGASVTMPDKLL